jgi:1-acyl-sn-glycerol-3-phosphate acyltransferase
MAVRIPKVSSDKSKSVTPYISASPHGAHVDPSYLVSTADRKLSSGVRTVQDPLQIKAKAAQVSFFLHRPWKNLL